MEIEKKKKKRKESSESSDLEQLLAISKKYKDRPRIQQKEEIPIKKKDVGITKVGDPPVPKQNGINKIPLNMHKNHLNSIRLNVANVPEPVDRDDFQAHIRKCLEMAGGIMDAGDPITQVQLGSKFNFIQLRSIEETDALLQLDGLIYHGVGLRFRRMKDHDKNIQGERPVPKLNLSKVQIQKIQTIVPDGPLKLYVGGLAPETDEESLGKLLGEYGNLRALHLVRVRNTFKGYAFCQYETELETQNCINGLNNKVIAGRLYQVKRGAQAQEIIQQNANYIIDTITIAEQGQFEIKLTQLERSKSSNVIKIQNAIRVNDIEDDKEHNFVVKDLRKEMDKIGRMLSIVAPRVKDGCDTGIGNVYVEFENEHYANIAVILLNGKKYDGKTLVVTLYDSKLYSEKVY